MPEPIDPSRRVPERLGKYPITAVLGEGAMGTVYRAHDPVIQRDVAIKTIRKELMDSDLAASEIAARFRNEARAVGRLAHPGIVAIYEYGEDETTAFIAMEFVQGRNLSQILATTPMLAEPVVLRLMDQLLDALDCAHGQGVWHRDIKPANLIITTSGQLKVTDFGIARIESAALTQVGSAIGTPGYMAPEQYVGEKIDHRVDLFAAGVLLYRLLTGVTPFRGAPETVMYKILSEDPVPPSQVEGAIGGQRYDAIVAMALAKDPAKRFGNASAFRRALSQGLDAAGADPSDATVIVSPRNAAARDASPAASGDTPAHTSQASITAGLAAMAANPGTARAPGAAAAPPTGSSAASALPTGWDASVLSQIEQALTQFVGPVARVLVRQAAKAHADLAGLQSALAHHVQGTANQAKFLSMSTPASTRTAVTGAPTGGTLLRATAPSSGTAFGTSLASASGAGPTEDMIETARRVLAHHIGPIAKIVVKKVLSANPSRERFAEMLADQGSDGNNRDTLLAELRKALG